MALRLRGPPPKLPVLGPSRIPKSFPSQSLATVTTQKPIAPRPEPRMSVVLSYRSFSKATILASKVTGAPALKLYNVHVMRSRRVVKTTQLPRPEAPPNRGHKTRRTLGGLQR